MGVSSHPFSSLVSLSLNDLEVLNDPSYLWSKVSVKGRRPRTRRVLMKRIGGSRRSRGRGAKSNNGIQSRVRTLKNLIPNSDNNMGLDGLFRETANYILSLQNRVRVMQVMVKVLTGSGGDDE
ncbi:transcription factor UPBEAT1 [Arachis stenosperma]|uniref:transcription factor UPBEAT1 n=1 Tax=Arachis stenosperma TaxID=217475 RepID=UPI0025ABDB33|nr:transcription factor UPBEAT1 [Arachis stenosperma]